VLLLLSPFVKDLDAYATDSCSPFLFWVRTAPQACLLASVIMQNSLLSLGLLMLI